MSTDKSATLTNGLDAQAEDAEALARPHPEAQIILNPRDAADWHTSAAYGICRSALAFGALVQLRTGNRRGAAALLVRLERTLTADGPLLQVRLALNHLPVRWVIACRAIEDAIAAGAPLQHLREAAQAGDPGVLRVALLARLGNDHLPQAERHLREAFEAAEREAAAS